jgi:hypothetical protein
MSVDLIDLYLTINNLQKSVHCFKLQILGHFWLCILFKTSGLYMRFTEKCTKVYKILFRFF